MKHRKKRSILCWAVLLVALQSCGLTGNNASRSASGPDVIRDPKRYIAEAQSDSNLKMVYLTKYLQVFSCDWPYAGTENFTKQALYQAPEAFVRLPVGRALQRVEAELIASGLRLHFFDAYRPYRATVKMWEIVPDERYAANPAKGSGHNRGIAVDLTLADLRTGKQLPMPTGFDDFSTRAHHDFKDLPEDVLHNRRLLRTVMEKHGFKAQETEWWHYYWSDGKIYSLMDLDFDQLRELAK